nr:pentatricopeptide repeat-containing protein At1g62350-like [Ipomoea trifida]
MDILLMFAKNKRVDEAKKVWEYLKSEDRTIEVENVEDDPRTIEVDYVEATSSPSVSIWRRKKEIWKECLMVAKELNRLQSDPIQLEQFMKSNVSRLLKSDILAVLAEFQRQYLIFLSMKEQVDARESAQNNFVLESSSFCNRKFVFTHHRVECAIA